MLVPLRAKTLANDARTSNCSVGPARSGLAGFTIVGNIFSDPTGTMGTRVINTYGGVDNGSFALDRNLFFNGSSPLPSGGSVTIDADANRIEGDPLMEADHSGIAVPRWDEASHRFPSGSTTIREEFLRLVETYGAIGTGSPAIDAGESTSMPADDIRGLARDSSPDIGAYEVGAGGAAGAGGASGSGGSATGGVGGSSGSGGSTGPAGGGSAGASGTGAAGTSGSAAQPAPDDEGGCGCGIPANTRRGWVWLVGLLVLSGLRRRFGRVLPRGGQSGA